MLARVCVCNRKRGGEEILIEVLGHLLSPGSNLFVLLSQET